MLRNLKDEMHLKVKMHVLQNCIAELEKTVLQHGECFSRVKDDKLGTNEHADKDGNLSGFIIRDKGLKAMLINLNSDLAMDRKNIDEMKEEMMEMKTGLMVDLDVMKKDHGEMAIQVAKNSGILSNFPKIEARILALHINSATNKQLEALKFSLDQT